MILPILYNILPKHLYIWLKLMLKLSLYFTIILLFVTSIFYLFFFEVRVPYSNNNEEEFSHDNLNKYIVKRDINLSSFANKITEGCGTVDKGCKNLKIYKYIKESYLLDNSTNDIQPEPLNILRSREGTYLDLSVLYASLLMNSGINSFITYENNKYYVFACGIKREEMYEAIMEDMKNNPLIKKELTLKEKQVWAFDFSRKNNKSIPVNIEIHSQKPVNMILFPNKTEMKAHLNNQYSRYDKECSQFNAVDINVPCIVSTSSILIVESLEKDNKFKGLIYKGGLLAGDISMKKGSKTADCIKSDLKSNSEYTYPGIL